jgi:hypothetical protein
VQQKNNLGLPGRLPKLSISSLKIDSYELLQPLHLSVNTILRNELSITGDVNADVKITSNALVAKITWRISELAKWIPQVQTLTPNNAELFKELTFDGEMLSADSSLGIASRFQVSSCPIDAVFKGNILIDVNVSSLYLSLVCREDVLSFFIK